MACRRCGSDWVTKCGKDKSSCPECCKQQRCKARGQGRLPEEECKQCERCGCEFIARGGNAIRRTRHCSSCTEAARREYLQAFKASARARLRKSKTQQKPDLRNCLRCGRQLNHNQSKYCGRECYNAAKKEGIQSWDRTKQIESAWHRGGRWAFAPSRKPMQEIMTNMSSFLRKVRSLYERASLRMPECEVCGSLCKTQEARFCSPRCCGQNVHEVSCCKCGEGVKRRGVGKVGLCRACKQNAKREALRRIRETCGRNHPSRARYYGVQCERFPRKMIFDRDGWTCQLCGTSVLRKTTYRKRDGKIHPRSPTVDCIVPMSKGGNYEPDNCQTACFICNSKKGAKRIGQLRLPIS